METSPRITLSPTAINEIERLRMNHPVAESMMLTIEVAQGGCMDWYYNLSFMAKAEQGDRPAQIYEGIEYILIAPSLTLLDGLHIDYSDDLMGGGFRFSNPNAAQTCGCGTSFSSQPDAIQPTHTMA